MDVKKWNEIFGYGLFSVGVLKALIIFLLIIQFGTNIAAVFNGRDIDSTSYNFFSTMIGYAQIVLAIGSIIMIILNVKEQPEIITGYLWGLGAILLELIVPAFLFIYLVFVECSMYMKAGSKIIRENAGQYTNNKSRREIIKNTEWFYGNGVDKEKLKESNLYREEANTNNEEILKNYVKENNSTVLLVSLIVLVLLIVGFIIYKVANNYYDNNIDNIEAAKAPEEISRKTASDNDVIEKREKKSNTDEIVTKKTGTSESKLNQIAYIFRNCSFSKKMQSQGYIMNATVSQNKITVFTGGDGLSFNVDFTLKNNILYTKIIYNQDDPNTNAIELILAIALVDCVGQVNGHPEGVLFTALGNDEALNYTIENEGVEIRNADNGYDVIIKVDLNSSFSFLDE